MKLAIFDFDGTFLEKQTLPFLYKLWKKQKLNNKLYYKVWYNILWHYFLSNIKFYSRAYFRAYAMQKTADLFSSVETDKLNSFLDLFYQTMKPYVSKKIKSMMLEDKKQGYYTILLSGNFDVILKPFINEGFDEVIGSISQKDGVFKKWQDIDIIISQKKQDIIKNKFPNADFKNSKAYADSDYDLPIFELVGVKIAVRPDKKLRKIAKTNNYLIVD